MFNIKLSMFNVQVLNCIHPDDEADLAQTASEQESTDCNLQLSMFNVQVLNFTLPDAARRLWAKVRPSGRNEVRTVRGQESVLTPGSEQ